MTVIYLIYIASMAVMAVHSYLALKGWLASYKAHTRAPLLTRCHARFGVERGFVDEKPSRRPTRKHVIDCALLSVCPIANTVLPIVAVAELLLIEVPAAIRNKIFGSKAEFERWMSAPIGR